MADPANSAVGAIYSTAVLDHFQNPRNAGELADATTTVDVSNPVCGDTLRLAVRVEGGRIVAARFKTRGCVTAIACSSFLTETICGKTLDEASAITAAQIEDALGGLPPASAHGAVLAVDALEAALRKAK